MYGVQLFTALLFQGTAYTFFTSKDMPKAAGLINILTEAGQKVPPELSRFGGGGRGYY
jgi:hypothetical protein